MIFGLRAGSPVRHRRLKLRCRRFALIDADQDPDPLRDELIKRNRVAERTAGGMRCGGEKTYVGGVSAVHVGMGNTAEHREVLAMLRQRLERRIFCPKRGDPPVDSAFQDVDVLHPGSDQQLPRLDGRGFVVAETEAASIFRDAGAVVLGYGLWQTRFGGDPRVLGSTIQTRSTPMRKYSPALWSSSRQPCFWPRISTARSGGTVENPGAGLPRR